MSKAEISTAPDQSGIHPNRRPDGKKLLRLRINRQIGVAGGLVLFG